jgi:hypothetical protein
MLLLSVAVTLAQPSEPDHHVGERWLSLVGNVGIGVLGGLLVALRHTLVLEEGVDLLVAVSLGEVDEDERRVPVLQGEWSQVAAGTRSLSVRQRASACADRAGAEVPPVKVLAAGCSVLVVRLEERALDEHHGVRARACRVHS